LSTRRILGFEALVRWDHPQQGVLGGDAVVQAALHEKAYDHLNWFVIQNAVNAAAELPDDLHVAINVLLGTRPIRDVHLALLFFAAQRGVSPWRFELELTETAPVPLDASSIEAFEAVTRDGVRLSLDDFGRGYSTLELLARLPIHVLKIDRAFVAALDDERMLGVVRGTVALARAMGAVCVAEGVETETQAVRLAAMGCQAAQGFLMSPGISLEEARELVSRRRKSRTAGRAGITSEHLGYVTTVRAAL
jgi:EAL domain-containing protein (putative c-di-GMP-specific phosphodiesterase class I)